MKVIFATLSVIALMSSLVSSAFCWLFIVPGDAVEVITNTLSGGKGSYCITESAKVGDTLNLKNGNAVKITAIVGPSSRCNDDKYPIRADGDLLYRPRKKVARALPPNITINIPDGWTKEGLSDISDSDAFLYLRNRTYDAGLLASCIRRDKILDTKQFVDARIIVQSSSLTSSKHTSAEEINVNGKPAWQFEVTGKLRSGKDVIYYYCIIEGDTEILVLRVFMNPEIFKSIKSEAYSMISSVRWNDNLSH